MSSSLSGNKTPRPHLSSWASPLPLPRPCSLAGIKAWVTYTWEPITRCVWEEWAPAGRTGKHRKKQSSDERCRLVPTPEPRNASSPQALPQLSVKQMQTSISRSPSQSRTLPTLSQTICSHAGHTHRRKAYLWKQKTVKYLIYMSPLSHWGRRLRRLLVIFQPFFKKCSWPCSKAVGSEFPDQGLNTHPLHWKLRFLTTGPPGTSPH